MPSESPELKADVATVSEGKITEAQMEKVLDGFVERAGRAPDLEHWTPAGLLRVMEEWK